MKKILCLVGPTATGKTKLALHLTQQYPSVLISADSRQVFRGMDIVTGQDQPKGVQLHGLNLVDPDQDCSVAVWYDQVKPLLSSDQLPIVVGGTGLWVRALTEGIPTLKVPPDQKLRQELETLSLVELQSRLHSLAPTKFTAMNHSDANNPRRLIRALEIASSDHHPLDFAPPDSLIIGLNFSDSSLYQSVVERRVKERIAFGAVEETQKLLAKYDRQLPSLTAIGYRSIIKFIDGEYTEKQMIDQWLADELNYAKRQMTWFRKVPALKWFDAADDRKEEKIAKLVSIWYAKR